MTDQDTGRAAVLKWVVPVDDQWHPIGGGPVALVEIQNMRDGAPSPYPVGVVTVWTIEPAKGSETTMKPARAFGTGQPLPPHAEHLGSCQDTSLVWHVFRSTVEGRP